MSDSLSSLCTPRQSVFDASRRDTVLDLTDLLDGKIDSKEFFTENYLTDGLKQLLRHGLRRLAGKSDQGVFILSQSMGGGKTHGMLTLGLLAVHPEHRKPVLGDIHESSVDPQDVRVIGFSGRESDAPHGIWGALAEQLGKKISSRITTARSRPRAKARGSTFSKAHPPSSCSTSYPPTLRTRNRNPSATPTSHASPPRPSRTSSSPSTNPSFPTSASSSPTSRPPTKAAASPSTAPSATSKTKPTAVP